MFDSSKSDTIGCFATSVIHDLRNPLATICAGTEMLIGPDLTAANVKRLAGNIHLAAIRMREMISDLMSIVQGDPAAVRICDLREIVVAASDSALAAKKPVRDSVLIAVEDTGLGIPDEVRDHLFEPFVTSGKPEGLGLGLAMARQTLRSQGGDMWTEPAAGARVVIRLPA